MRRIFQVLLGGSGLLVLYAFFISTIEQWEIALGAGIATIAVIVSLFAHAAMGTSWALRDLVNRDLLGLPFAVLRGVRDYVRLVVMRVFRRPVRSRFEWTAVPGDPRDLTSRRSATMRAVALVVMSFAPSTFVVDSHIDDGVLLHRIDAGDS
jgi:hypothetical protein